MPQVTILSLGLGPGEKGRTEKQAPLSRRKMTFCFSITMVSRGSSVLVSRSGAWTGGPGTLAPHLLKWGYLDLQWLPLHTGNGPGGSRAISWTTSLFDTLWKCPSCLHW
jgi:hypothetical protein